MDAIASQVALVYHGEPWELALVFDVMEAQRNVSIVACYMDYHAETYDSYSKNDKEIRCYTMLCVGPFFSPQFGASPSKRSRGFGGGTGNE